MASLPAKPGLPPESDEALLVERAKERSPSAWAQIYGSHYARLHRYCYARTGDRGVAEDLASQVFLEALKGINRYVYRGQPLLAWLYRIARNLVSDHLRTTRRESVALQHAASTLEPHDPSPASAVGDRQDLQAVLAHLTDDQRQLIALRYYADFSTADIAAAMERSERAIYSLEVRALAALRRILEPDRVGTTSGLPDDISPLSQIDSVGDTAKR